VSDFRDDLAALMVDREEQARLDGELGITAARMAGEPDELVAALRSKIADLELVAKKARGLVRTAYIPPRIADGEVKVVRTWWDSLVKALKVLDDS
jgi:hypothetical protein